jgi:hypothetical protein
MRTTEEQKQAEEGLAREIEREDKLKAVARKMGLTVEGGEPDGWGVYKGEHELGDLSFEPDRLTRLEWTTTLLAHYKAHKTARQALQELARFSNTLFLPVFVEFDGDVALDHKARVELAEFIAEVIFGVRRKLAPPGLRVHKVSVTWPDESGRAERAVE